MANSIKLLVGLANPGNEYAQTRHNAGAWVIEHLARLYNISMRHEDKFFGLTGRIVMNTQDIRLLIPTTFMNLSGKSIAALANFYQIKPQEILLVHDELDLPVGVAKFKLGGGHGGHNGLKDTISKLANCPDFYRLRIGIGHPGSKELVTNFVLNKPSEAERKLLEAVVNEASLCCEILIKENLITAQSKLHAFKAQ